MDIYSTAELTRRIDYLPSPSSWFLDRYFPEVVTFQTEEIYFDVAQGSRRLSPFVSPLSEGKIVEQPGFYTNVLRPAYIKDKRVFDPTRPFRRSIGEGIGGTLDPTARLEAYMASTMTDQLNMLTRRQEWMATQSLVNGGYTISGEKYQTAVINFGRTSTQQIQLTGAQRWGQTGVSVLDNLQTWASQMQLASGLRPTDLVLDVLAWEIFRKDPVVVQQRQFFQNPSQVVTDATQTGVGGVSMGNINGFNVFVYQDWYVDDNGVTQPMLPINTALLLSPLMEGVRHYGAIKDFDAGLVARNYFPKSWVTPDPSVRYLMLQSAPLVAPYRPNASFAVTVA